MEMIFEYLKLVRIYTKPKGARPCRACAVLCMQRPPADPAAGVPSTRGACAALVQSELV